MKNGVPWRRTPTTSNVVAMFKTPAVGGLRVYVHAKLGSPTAYCRFCKRSLGLTALDVRLKQRSARLR